MLDHAGPPERALLTDLSSQLYFEIYQWLSF